MKSAGVLLACAAVTMLSGCGSPAASDAEQKGEGTAAATASAAASAAKASFDCAKAGSSAEKLVCSDPLLAELDVETARLYALAEATPGGDAQRMAELRATQRGWIKGRDDCWKADDEKACVTASYAGRILDLRQGYANARSADGAGISMGPLALACDGLDFGIGAVFINGSTSLAQLAWKDRAVTLASGPTGSGAQYTGSAFDGEYRLWTKGDEALFTLPGKPEAKCRIEQIG